MEEEEGQYGSKSRKKEGEEIGNSSSCRKVMREKQTEKNCSWQDLFFVSNGELQKHYSVGLIWWRWGAKRKTSEWTEFMVFLFCKI